jgi:hypothetical protein
MRHRLLLICSTTKRLRDVRSLLISLESALPVKAAVAAVDSVAVAVVAEAVAHVATATAAAVAVAVATAAVEALAN